MIPQNKLNANVARTLRWGSHIPVNKSAIKVFNIVGVLELGAGLHSTSLFFDNCEYVYSVESDKDWIEKLKLEQVVKESANHRLVYDNLPNYIDRATQMADIDKNIIDSSIDLYRLCVPPKNNLLFIDNYAGFRLPALLNMYYMFDVILYHDTEPKENHHYNYDQFKTPKDYYHFHDRTFAANTGILISKKFDIQRLELFEDSLRIEADKYAKRFNTSCKVVLEKL